MDPPPDPPGEYSTRQPIMAAAVLSQHTSLDPPVIVGSGCVIGGSECVIGGDVPPEISLSSSSETTGTLPESCIKEDGYTPGQHRHSMEPTAQTIPDINTSLTFHTKKQLDNYIKVYSTEAGFIVRDDRKAYFSETAYKQHFDTPFERVARRGYYRCSPRSKHRCHGMECPFQVGYCFDERISMFALSPGSTTLSHNHQLSYQMTTMDGREQVVFKDFLTHDEAQYIKELSLTKTDIPTMSVHLEDRFQGRCFTHDLLHRLKKQHLAAKFGPGGHDLTDLFKKGELIRQLGGSFVVIPSKTDLGVKSIHCQKKLMAQYARLYGDFKMADGTHKLSQYEYVFVFFMVIDCLLKSKFVGYTIIFAENTESIIEGAEIFFPHECAPMKDNKLYVGKLDGHFDPFVDREIDLSSPDKSPVEPNWSVQSPVDAPGTVPMSISSSGESGTVAATANTNLVPVVPEKLPSNDNGSNESRQSIATGASGVKMEYGKMLALRATVLNISMPS